jgi:branched-chain amino acid transport system substrate-binding protein
MRPVMRHRILLHLAFAFLCPGFCTQASAEPDLTLGFLGPLTGNAAVLGADALPAMQIAIEEEKANGLDIHLAIEDDQYITSKTINGFKKLTSVDEVDAMVLLTYGGLFALQDTIAKQDILVIDTLDCDEEIAKIKTEKIVCISKGTEDLGEVIAKEIVTKNIPAVSFLYFDGDPFMGILSKATRNYLENNGTTSIVSYDGFSNTSDFKSMLLKARKAGSKGYIFYGYDDLGNAMFQARIMGIQDPFFGVVTIMSPGFRGTARGTEEGTYVSSYLAPRNERYDSFITAFKEKTGRIPSFEPSTFPSYDTVKILAEGVRKYRANTETKPLREFLIEYMYTIKDHDGLSGTITIDPDGATRTLKSRLFQVKDGELVDPVR